MAGTGIYKGVGNVRYHIAAYGSGYKAYKNGKAITTTVSKAVAKDAIINDRRRDKTRQKQRTPAWRAKSRKLSKKRNG